MMDEKTVIKHLKNLLFELEQSQEAMEMYEGKHKEEVYQHAMELLSAIGTINSWIDGLSYE